MSLGLQSGPIEQHDTQVIPRTGKVIVCWDIV